MHQSSLFCDAPWALGFQILLICISLLWTFMVTILGCQLDHICSELKPKIQYSPMRIFFLDYIIWKDPPLPTCLHSFWGGCRVYCWDISLLVYNMLLWDSYTDWRMATLQAFSGTPASDCDCWDIQAYALNNHYVLGLSFGDSGDIHCGTTRTIDCKLF